MDASALSVTHATGRYGVTVEPLDALPARLAAAGLDAGRVLVVTDDRVQALHGARLADVLREGGWEPAVFSVAPGEASKSLSAYSALMDWALGLGPTRATPLLAFGGGVVGDLGGFAAATLLRGLPLVQAPTTTIAQVDSAIGGKTGINHAAGKNLIGAFWPPRHVLADPALLSTLPERDFASGLAEAVKHALLDGPQAIATLGDAWDAVAAREPGALARTIRLAAGIKAAVVSADEREGGARAFLNLGHTFAHAVEREAGYGTVTHGEAVAFGLRAALHLSARLLGAGASGGETLAPDTEARFGPARALVARLPRPVIPASVTDDALVRAMATDKKRDAGGLRFVVLDAPGAPRLADGVDAQLVLGALAHARAA